jgi:hypothetical protein
LPLLPSPLRSRRRSIHFHPHSYLLHRKTPQLQKTPYPKMRLSRGFLTCRSSGPPNLTLHPAPQRPTQSPAHLKRRSRRTLVLAGGTMHDQNLNPSSAHLTLKRMDIAKGGNCQLYKDHLLSRAQRSLELLPSVPLALQILVVTRAAAPDCSRSIRSHQSGHRLDRGCLRLSLSEIWKAQERRAQGQGERTHHVQKKTRHSQIAKKIHPRTKETAHPK